MQGDQLGPVVIGPREIYDAVLRLTTTVDRLVARDEERAEQQVDHETRLRVLERGRWPLPALAVVLSLAALVVTVLPMLAGGKH